MAEPEDRNLVDLILSAFPWLSEIPGIFDIIMEGVTQDLPTEIVLANIRESDAYKERFPAMAVRKSEEFNPITEAEYLKYEDDYRSLLRGYGVLGIFGPDDAALNDLLTGWIGGDVSPMELSLRLDQGYAAMVDAAPGVREAFQDFYGIELDDITLLTYFLDEDLGISEMEQVVAASTVGGAALKYGLNITRTRAELLVGEGVTGEIASRGYANVARELPQLEKLAKMHYYNPLTQVDLEELFFHEDPEVMRQRQKIFDTALADFKGAGASSVTRRGTLGELVDIDPSV